MDKQELLKLVAKFGNIRFRMGRTQFYDTHESHNEKAKEIYGQITEAIELPPASIPSPVAVPHQWHFGWQGKGYTLSGPTEAVNAAAALYRDFTDRVHGKDLHWWQFHYLGTDYRVQGPKVNIDCLSAMFNKLMMKQPITDPVLPSKWKEAADQLEQMKYTYMGVDRGWRAPKTRGEPRVEVKFNWSNSVEVLLEAISTSRDRDSIMKRALLIASQKGEVDDDI